MAVTPDRYKPLLDRDFLKSQLAYEYRDYLANAEDTTLLARLEGWAKRELKRGLDNSKSSEKDEKLMNQYQEYLDQIGKNYERRAFPQPRR